MIETRCLKNVVIFIQSILSFVLSRKINKYKLKFKSKPWITLSLQKPIYICEKQITRKFH